MIQWYTLMAGKTRSGERVSLYDQLGGEPGVSAIADDFYDRISTDDLLGKWFVDVNGAGIRFHLRAYLTVALGGPEEYSGRSLRVAHQGLRISVEAWNRMLVLLAESFRSGAVDDRLNSEVIAIISTLRAVIVEVR
jgi:hemoglobin